MSEIVRPTRDGIHGREYISTSIDLGRKPMFLVFDEEGKLLFEPPPLLELPLPVVLAEPPVGPDPERLRQILAAAAQTLGTVALIARDAIIARAAWPRRPPWCRSSRPATWTCMIRSWPRSGPWSSRTTPRSSATWRP